MNKDKDIDKNTTSDKKIKTLIENQKRASSWLGKWYWQIRIDKEIKKKPYYIKDLDKYGAEGDEDNF
jgi:hypothetical protein